MLPHAMRNRTCAMLTTLLWRQVTGFSNTEEDAVGKAQYVPFLLEDKLKELGGKYEKKGDWQVSSCQ